MAYRFVQLYDKDGIPTFPIKGPVCHGCFDQEDSTGYWYKFADISMTGNHTDILTVFQVTKAYNTWAQGILVLHARRDTSTTISSITLEWSSLTQNIRPKHYAFVSTENKISLYYYRSYRWEEYHFEIIKGDNRNATSYDTSAASTVLYNYNNATGVTALPTGLKSGYSYYGLHKVGDIICTTSATDPSTYYGGTWAKITDRFLVGAGNTYSATGTGGGTVTLGVANIPAHTHSIAQHNHWWGNTSGESGWHEHSCVTYNGATGSYEFVRPNGWSSQNTGRAIAGNGTHTHWSEGWTSTNGATATGSTGSTSAFSVVPAYYGVYFWRRTA